MKWNNNPKARRTAATDLAGYVTSAGASISSSVYSPASNRGSSDRQTAGEQASDGEELKATSVKSPVKRFPSPRIGRDRRSADVCSASSEHHICLAASKRAAGALRPRDAHPAGLISARCSLPYGNTARTRRPTTCSCSDAQARRGRAQRENMWFTMNDGVSARRFEYFYSCHEGWKVPSSQTGLCLCSVTSQSPACV